MPTSDPASHPWMASVVAEAMSSTAEHEPKVVDCGVGVGLVARSLAEAFDPGALAGRRPLAGIDLVGLELFAPYVTDLRLRNNLRYDYLALYRSLVLGRLGDFRWWLAAAPPGSADVVVFGDSLEHVEPGDAEDALASAFRVASNAVVVNAPIVELQQGPVHGNEAERHRVNWGRATWEALGGTYLGGDEVVACFAWRHDDPPPTFPPRRRANQAGGAWFDASGNRRPITSPTAGRPPSVGRRPAPAPAARAGEGG